MFTTRRLAFLLPLILLLPCAAMADSQQQLESHFKNKLFYIRGFYRDNKLSYDAQGDVQGQPHVGPWTVALFHIKKVEARDHEFMLEGTRAVSRFDKNTMKFVNFLPQKHETINIRVETGDQPLSDDALNALESRMFLTGITTETAPEWWHDFFAGKKSSPSGVPADTHAAGMDSSGQPVLRAGAHGKINRPEIITKSEPTYEELARTSGLQGSTLVSIVVSKAGVPEHIQITRPLGMGLDDKAVESISKWRFKPATLNGQPVAVVVGVEVNFRLN